MRQGVENLLGGLILSLTIISGHNFQHRWGRRPASGSVGLIHFQSPRRMDVVPAERLPELSFPYLVSIWVWGTKLSLCGIKGVFNIRWST